jgi:hypothetical protein
MLNRNITGMTEYAFSEDKAKCLAVACTVVVCDRKSLNIGHSTCESVKGSKGPHPVPGAYY